MSSLHRDHVPYADPEFEMVPGANGSIIARGAPGNRPFMVLRGDLKLMSAVLQTIDGERTVARVCQALSDRYASEEVVATIEELLKAGHVGIRGEASPPNPEMRRYAAEIIGSGALAQTLERHLWELGIVAVHRVSADGLAPEQVFGRAGPRGDLLVCALEDVSYEWLRSFERTCMEAGVPCLFVTYERGRILIGPTTVPGHTPGFWATRLALAGQHERRGDESIGAGLGRFTAQKVGADDEVGRRLLARAAAIAAEEVERCLGQGPLPRLFSSTVVVEGNAIAELTLPPEAAPPDTGRLRSFRELGVSADIVLGRLANLTPRSPEPKPTTFRSVGIVGGGTAGYLTALALKRKLPQLEVTVVESSKIPIIGVGEATTALLVHFLHRYLGLDIVDFYQRVQPTWKLGIRFEWGLPGGYFYNSPFQFGRILEALLYDGDINRSCLASCLMSANRTSILQSDDGSYRSLLSEIPYAYHLDNKRFVHYLREQAAGFGVRRMDCVVEAAATTDDGRSIQYLRTDDGRRFEFDLFVDCTGFRSLLLEKTLGSRYLGYESSLFTDTAVMADLRNEAGVVRPYTTAETMSNGWCWTIPMEDSDHCGYVFSSAFTTIEQAAEEMRTKNRGIGECWTTQFRCGRHEDFWKSNVVAIGNAYGFVEPLQSTAIHMIIIEIQKMIEFFPAEAGLSAFQPVLNRRIGAVWDHLRWFLAAHYRYNNRLDTQFWRECRTTTDVSGLQELIDLYHERAPIGSTAVRFEELDDSTFGVFRHDLLFMGQQMKTNYVRPEQSRAAWERISSANDRLVQRAVHHREGLRVVRRHPEILRHHVRSLG